VRATYNYNRTGGWNCPLHVSHQADQALEASVQHVGTTNWRRRTFERRLTVVEDVEQQQWLCDQPLFINAFEGPKANKATVAGTRVHTQAEPGTKCAENSPPE